ncbi:uncharacterized protein LOC129569026 [Sitodiplosis mosellana]|uniref:uncharacterized protein LOC129569026 n=1 Tax=Sitodiplosis mosellana TaxID=263140 RepID=UPI00244375F0|nr:uncharacterized protein LOC129569026 [Sitodiplosis mosellana]
MNANTRKIISKETQEAVKRFLTSNISIRNASPQTPNIMDQHFSRILQKKREEQLEASRQRLFDSRNESAFGKNGSMPVEKDITLDNSMIFFGRVNKSWRDVSGEDSFLAMERQCNMEDKTERIINANDTLLFDIEPPAELWNQTVNQSDTVEGLDKSKDKNDYKDEYDEEKDDGDETIEISPVKYIGLIRPSTIIEETSSQLDSYNKNGSTLLSTKSSLYETASINESVNGNSSKSIDDLSVDGKSSATDVVQLIKNDGIESDSKKENGSNANHEDAIASPFDKQCAERQRRGTFAFKRDNYTFFPDQNLEPIDESGANRSLIDFGAKSKDDNSIENEDQFNNTLERVDYLLERGKQIWEETPIAKRSTHHQSLMETPLFSCKRKRLLNEMASIEMLPLAKRGPLIDCSTPEILHKMRFNKFSGK